MNYLTSRRNAIARETRALLDRSKGQKWTPAMQAAYDKNLAEIDAINSELTATNTKDRAAASLETFDRDFRTFAQHGWGGFEPERLITIQNTMSTGTGSQGAFTVSSDVSSRFADSLKDYSGIRRVAEVVVTDNGNTMPWPTSDGTSETGELVAENAAVASADPTFGTAAMPTYKYSSKVITVPLELLQDSNIDLEGFIADRCAQRIGRISNTHFTVGSGTGQPNGIATAVTVGKTGTTGQTTSIIHDDVVDLIHSVNGEYRQDSHGAQFMGSDAALKMLRKVKDSQNRPLYLPADGESPESVMGYPFVINNDVAAPAANAKSILFGNFWRAYKVRDSLEVTLYRMADSGYVSKGQVGFLAFMRTGGNLVDASAIRAYAHSAT